MSTVNKVSPGKLEKQPYEEFVVAADFSKNMDVAGGEDLVLGSCTVVAEDVNGDDATSDVTDQGTISIGTGTEQGWLKCLVKAGTVALTPYKVSFRGVTDSTPAEKWEKDVIVKIKEV